MPALLRSPGPTMGFLPKTKKTSAYSVGILLLVVLAACAFTSAPVLRQRMMQPMLHACRAGTGPAGVQRVGVSSSGDITARKLHSIGAPGPIGNRCRCLLGSQPGTWLGLNRTDPEQFGLQYASLVPGCDLINYVGRNATALATAGRPINILSFGDSVDRMLLNGWCDLQARANMTLNRWPRIR